MKRILSILVIAVMFAVVFPTDIVSAATSAGYVWPIEGQGFSRGFTSAHEALDISAGTGIAVKSINSGTVFCASMVSALASHQCNICGHKGAGYHVAINHPNGIKAMYAHLSNVNVYVGQTVSSGQQIGNVGSTGNSSGSHLHLALFLNGFSDAYAVDPLKYLSPFSNIYVSDISKSSATIHGVLGSYGIPITSAGIYIGTSPSNMTKVTETLNLGYGNSTTSVFYGTQKWYGTLKEGTKYYYKVWINSSGIEYASDVKFFETLGTHSHIWSAWTTIRSATCTNAGFQRRTCSCGTNETKSIAAIGHKYEIVSETEPTCLLPGTVKYQCLGCKETYSTSISSVGHSFGEYIYNNDATSTVDGTKTRICSVCGHSETVTAPGTKWTNPFTDVPSGQYYTDPVLWAVSKGVTTGTSATTFSPEAACTRGQIVTFLWRAAGSPEPQSSRNPFVDVPSNQYYYKAVLWAVEKGITTGMDATHFSPDASCTRGQIVTFLWRAKGKPAANSSNPFYDVSGSAYYYSPVLWVVKNGITTGMSATSFAPDAPCTRAQIVTFLYRTYK